MIYTLQDIKTGETIATGDIRDLCQVNYDHCMKNIGGDWDYRIFRDGQRMTPVELANAILIAKGLESIPNA